ncbi:acyltransferase family protein [Pseudomonas sp. RL_15y_Pfl2_60]|uniref:acyltransferase family protein n=1 Tax=Pseudomonas sp. RL_15y_Pfl2_60 TaxID=3088709 RepID=UPI0030DD7A63
MKQQSVQRNDIQGLRAIAVLSVIIYHINKEWLPGGFIGVDIFFVISGFLITGIVLHQLKNKSFSLKAFYISRLKRIVPAYMALLIIVTLVAAVFLIPRDFDSYWESLKAAVYFNSNNFFANQHDYFAPAAYEFPLLHLWSLAVEMQYYLLLPLLILVTPKNLLKSSIVLIAGGLTIYSARKLSAGLHQEVYFSLLSRVPEFLIGGIFAVGKIGERWKPSTSNVAGAIGFVLVVSSFWLITERSEFPGLLALPPCVGVALVIAAQNSLVNRLLSNSILVWIGALSYSLYLWHWPVLAMLRYFGGDYILPTPMLTFFALLTTLLAILSYYLIELPFRSKKNVHIVIPTFLVVVFISSVFISSILNSKLVTPLRVELTRYAPENGICHGMIVGDCIRGDHSANKLILLLGDSHAAQLNFFADELGNRLRSKIKVITASSCVTIEGFDIDRLPRWAREPCQKQIQFTKSNIDAADIIIIAGMWQYQAVSTAFLKALDRFINNAAIRGKPVIVLSQVPMLQADVQRAYRFRELGFKTSVQMNKDWEAANQKIELLVAKHSNAIFLNFSKLPLFSAPPFNDGTLIYRDNHHLNEVGSRRYGIAASSSIATAIELLTRHH